MEIRIEPNRLRLLAKNFLHIQAVSLGIIEVDAVYSIVAPDSGEIGKAKCFRVSNCKLEALPDSMILLSVGDMDYKMIFNATYSPTTIIQCCMFEFTRRNHNATAEMTRKELNKLGIDIASQQILFK